MVLDSSAVIAILGREPEERGFRHAIKMAPGCRISAPTFVETGIVVLSRKGEPGLAQMRALLEALHVEVVPLSSVQAQLALDAYGRFGKGRHPAALNFGDCFSYALALAMDEPLLFKGDDFTHTDIKHAVWSMSGDQP